jgi:hypothetical protein
MNRTGLFAKRRGAHAAQNGLGFSDDRERNLLRGFCSEGEADRSMHARVVPLEAEVFEHPCRAIPRSEHSDVGHARLEERRQARAVALIVVSHDDRHGAVAGLAARISSASGNRSRVTKRALASHTIGSQPTVLAMVTTGTASCPPPTTKRRGGGRTASMSTSTGPEFVRHPTTVDSARSSTRWHSSAMRSRVASSTPSDAIEPLEVTATCVPSGVAPPKTVAIAPRCCVL